MFFPLLLFFLLSFPSFAEAPHTSDKIAFEAKWLKLLHYKKSLWGYESEADGKEFFLHPMGKTDPAAELEKSIEIFSRELHPVDGHPICKFPLRYKWLNQRLGHPWKADFSGCARYIEFFSKLAARRASIIFSSYYLSNPNSAFGHTLLRLSRYADANETEMLDYGINYSAAARATNPLTYALKGLFGGYQGKFAAIPYYYKIREYSNSEFRDLWSYDLKLTLPQILEMVDHIWELGHTHFDYFYFHENCSYHLLSIIDVALPDKNLTDKFNWFTIPADTIRVLAKEGLIEKGKKRESTYSKLSRLSQDLSEKELSLSKEVAQHPEKVETVLAQQDENSSADILDVSLEAFDYLHADKILSDDKKAQSQKNFILQARARNPVITEEKIMPETLSESPALSHSPVRLGLFGGYAHHLGSQSRFEFRTAFHDLLDPPQGSLRDGELEMGRVSVLQTQKNYGGGQFLLDHFSILSIKNYPGQDFWASPFSWEIGVGATQMKTQSCLDCPGGYLNGSIGNSLHLNDHRFLVALLLNADLNVHNTFQENYRLGLGPKVYARYRWSDRWLSSLSLVYHWNTFSGQRMMTNQRLSPDFETRFHMNVRFSLVMKTQGIEEQRRWTYRAEVGLHYFY